ncbi:MAG: thioredoxin domain-containing protein [Nitratireductor sp.]|nr:thioredoxin domain-containing protein [Nitratireductor sp.]
MAVNFPQRNLLAGQSSPYLLQHADNPVHWRPWGEEALSEARETDKPILLSIGYAACHWCHVMAHESFENPQIAALMNQLYVNVKVDREERPDIDQVYMAALHALGEQGGWPLTMFLAPDGRPFWGGTYFPPQSRYGRPGFPQVLEAIEKAYRTERQTIEKNASVLNAHLQELSQPPGRPANPDLSMFDTFATRLLAMHDLTNGGLRGAPKFPNAPMTEIWLRAACRKPEADFRKAFLHTLERISQGGIYDHVGGGLARYSTDENWLVPHFEKMLYDNAHYIRLLTRAWQLDSRPLFRVRIEESIEWLTREMRMPGGAFASSLDADSEGEEGRYYVWTKGDIDEALGNNADLFSNAYDVTLSGNFHESGIPGANVLNRLNVEPGTRQEEELLAQCRNVLFALREKRIRPGLDDKILCDWNGYMIQALAEAGFVFNRKDWVELAETAFRFICESMAVDGEFSHSWRDGIHVRPGLATDYGSMANASIALNGATGNGQYLEKAGQWLAILERDYTDGQGGYYLTSLKAGDITVRPRADFDEANPSGASQILEAVIRLARLTGDPSLFDRARKLAANLYSASMNATHGSAGYANASHSLLNGRHAKIYADEPADAEAWIDILRHTPDPSLTWQIVPAYRKDSHFGLELIPPPNRPAAILCSDNACSAPLTSPQAFREALGAI